VHQNREKYGASSRNWAAVREIASTNTVIERLHHRQELLRTFTRAKLRSVVHLVRKKLDFSEAAIFFRVYPACHSSGRTSLIELFLASGRTASMPPRRSRAAAHQA
jgi:hypothetical protein